MEKLKALLGLQNNKEQQNAADKNDNALAEAVASGDVVISPDTLRENRIPPGQYLTKKWPVLHAGMVPSFNPQQWNFRIFGLVEQEWQCNYQEFMQLPTIKVKSDFHCVTTWSLLDNLWEGVSTREILSKVKVSPEVKYVVVHAEHRWTTNLPFEDFIGDDCLFAYKHNGQNLDLDHGYPLRLVVPRLYAWKSAKWVRGIELLAEDRPGFWEQGGYHMKGDPWREQRFRWGG
jgi:DMSO/TMAO reductase YedYZ molybdopterin-dependent catalytic subunit